MLNELPTRRRFVYEHPPYQTLTLVEATFQPSDFYDGFGDVNGTVAADVFFPEVAGNLVERQLQYEQGQEHTVHFVSRDEFVRGYKICPTHVRRGQL